MFRLGLLLFCLGVGIVEAGVARRNGAGPRSASMAGADVTNSGDPLAAVSQNPALLSSVEKATASVSATTVYGRGEYRNSRGENYTFDKVGVLPELAIALPIGESPFTFGLGVTVTAAGEADWFYRDIPGGADGTATFGSTEHSSRFLAIRSAAGLSYAVTDSLTIGVSGAVVYEEFQLQAPYIFQSNPALGGFKAALDLDTDGYSGNGEIGMHYQASDQVSFGLSYRSPTPISSKGRADGTLDAQLASLGLRDFDPNIHYDAEVETALPQSVTVGASFQANDRLRLALQLEWIDWSAAYDSLDITLTNGGNRDLTALAGQRIEDSVPLRWDDQVIVRAGIEYAATDRLTLRGGYAFGSNPMPENLVSPVNAALGEHLISFGLGYDLGPSSIDVGYQYELPHAVNTGRSGFAAGEYSDSRIEIQSHSLSVGITYEF